MFVESLEPRGQVDVRPDGRVVEALSAAEVADIRHASVNADARAQDHAVGAGKFRDALLQEERRAKDAVMVIGLAEWRVPNGEQRVADQLYEEAIGLIHTGDGLLEIVIH